MINAAFTNSTWKSLQSAINCVQIFCKTKNFPFNLPFETEFLFQFTTWALTIKGLKHSTVSYYLHAIELYHRLKGFDNYSTNNTVLKMLIKGSENMSIYSNKKNHKRNVMTLPLMKILGHEISTVQWSAFEKQLIWSVSCLAFFGSFRIGELLCNNNSEFDPRSSLIWENVKIQDSSILIHIRSPKSKNKLGDYVDIFKFKHHNCCPVKTFMMYKNMCDKKMLYDKKAPVFRHENGKILTKNNFCNIIRVLLGKRCKDLDANISGHSFRAGIPAALARFPEISTEKHIMGWGRWDSSAYLVYTRLKSEQKRKIFEKIVSVLNFKCNK